MAFLKIASIAIVALVTIILLKDIKAEYALIVTVVAGILLMTLFLEPMGQVIGVFSDLTAKAKLSPSIFNLLIKIIGIGYLTDYTSCLCDDFDAKSLGKKVELGGKLIILVMAMPIVQNIITLIGSLIN